MAEAAVQELVPQREAILRAAARLFREKGYERTTVRDLANAVGLQSGSLFHHFSTKTEILAEVMKRGLELAGGQVAAAVTVETTPDACLRALFRSYLKALLSPECRDYMTVLLYDFRSLPPDLAREVSIYRSTQEDRWRGVLREALPDHWSEAEIRLVAQFVFGAMCWSLQWYNPSGVATLDELAEQFMHMALSACRTGDFAATGTGKVRT
jgi:AcrR family transcriptional regulator